MLINKNWFYILDEEIGENITIEKNCVVCIFIRNIKNLKFDIKENAFVDIFTVYSWEESELNLETLQSKNNSNLKIWVLIIWKEENHKNIKVKSIIDSNDSKTKVSIISILWDKSFVDLDWIIKIEKNVIGSKARLEEENIFLWNKVNLRWVPTLLVESNDVEASHACKIEKISDEKLFYLRSRWIEKNNSITLMIEAKIKNLFKCIKMLDKDFYDEIIKNSLKKIF